MFYVGKINTINNTFRSNTLYEENLSSFGNNQAARKIYLEMNEDIYNDFVDGDISLAGLLQRKLKNFWNIITNSNPELEKKAQIIEETLKENAEKKLFLDRVA